MSWLKPSVYEQELFQDAQNNWPDTVELAKYTVLCPRIEPLLLRNMRLKFIPGSEPDLEHRFWFSPLISARSTSNIILHQGVARLLAEQLTLDNETFEKVWQFTRDWTSHWNALDRLEQQLRRAAFLNDEHTLKQGMQDILKKITETETAEQRLDLARWSKKTLATIASNTNASNELAWLSQYAATALGATASWTRYSSTEPLPKWLAKVIPKTAASTMQSRIGLQLRYDADSQNQVLECLAAEEVSENSRLTTPTPLPARLYIKCTDQSEGRWEIIDIGRRIKIKPISKRLELRTIDGQRYELQAEFEPTPWEDNQAQSIRLYLIFVKGDGEIATKISRQLQQQNIPVTLIEEQPGSTAFEHSQDLNARLLRLWTPTAQSQWSSIEQELLSAAHKSLLLRMNQAPLPDGSMSADIIDLDKSENFLEEVTHWLKNTEEPAPELQQFDALLKELKNPSTTPQRRLEIGDLLAEKGDPRQGVGVKEYEVIKYPENIQRLLDELYDTTTEPPRRLEIGDQLAELDDPRPGVGLNNNGLPNIDWVEIPVGEFIYGEDNSQQILNLDRFYISRYLITNGQFQAFIDAGAYQDERWWQDLNQPEPEKSRWTLTNRPREAVDWYEALAFTRWLSEELGYTISLPTEQQWEKAARGTDGRAYPWGNDYRSGYANIDEKYEKAGPWYLEETTAVGLYPQGASPYGVEDMSGNVWEWCLNKDERPEDMGMDSSGDMRVVRGGSWVNNPEFARCANRNWNVPVNRYNNIGFRVVCLSPYTDH